MVKKKIDMLICNSSKLLTLRGSGSPRIGDEMKELSTIKDGAIAIDNGIIIEVGETSVLSKKYKNNVKTVIDAEDKLVMPGFVDCHTHVVFGDSREYEFEMKIGGASYLDILEKGGGIHSTVNATKMKSKTDLIEDTIKKLDLMLMHGTTTVEAKSGYGLDYNNEKKILETINDLKIKHPMNLIATYLGAHVFPKNIDNEDYVNLILNEALPDFTDLAEYCDIFVEKGAFSLDNANSILNAAKKLGYKIKMHAGQFNDLEGVLEFASKIKAVSVDHLDVDTSDKKLNALKKSGTAIVLLPGVSFFLMTGKYADARRMIDNGNIVALATDFNPGSCPTYSMQCIIALACYNMKMLPSEAIIASTINAAHAINRGDQIGSIEVGKVADIIIMNIQEPSQIPYYFGVNLIKKVIKSGKIVIE